MQTHSNCLLKNVDSIQHHYYYVVIIVTTIIKVIINININTTVATAPHVKLQPEFVVCNTKPCHLGSSVLWSIFHY